MTSHRVHCSLRQKCVFVVLVLQIADNMLCTPTPRGKGVIFWEAKGRWPGSMSLFLQLKCQPPTTAATFLCCASLPRSLGSAAGYIAHSCRSTHQVSSWLKGVSATTGFLPSLTDPHCELEATGCIPDWYQPLYLFASPFAPVAHL